MGASVEHAAVSERAVAGGQSARVAHLRALVGARGRIGVIPPPSGISVPFALDPGAVSTGLPGLDAWVRGWPRPGPVEIVGGIGAGRLALVQPLLERLTRQGRSVVVVDALQQLHPPGLGEVDRARLVLVRTPPERAAWVSEQVARSGAADVLLVLDAPALGRGGIRLVRAAEAGNVLTFVLSGRTDPDLPAALRMEVLGWQGAHLRVRCSRSRDGRRVGERLIAVWERGEPSQVRPVEAGSVHLARVGGGAG